MSYSKAAIVRMRMDEVIKIITSSSVSSHHKGETLEMLTKMRDQEILKIVADEVNRVPE